MKDEQAKDLMAWSFPSVESVIDNNEQLVRIKENTDDDEDDDDDNEKIKKEINDEKLSEIILQKEELNQLKIDYRNKIALTENILKQLESSISLVDDELIEIIQDIIKKSIKKLIFKEIAADPQLINKIITELKKLIQAQDGLINVYLSEKDYQKIEATDNSNPSLMFNVDPSLAEGDIVIKTNSTEIRAVLDERIEQLMRNPYD